MDPEATIALEAEGLVRTFGRVRAVDGVDIALRAGETLALLGPNGAGKSTLLGLLAGTIAPERGTVRVATRTRSRDESLAYVRELPVVYDDLTVREHLEFVARGRKILEPRRAIAETLAATGLTAQSERPAGVLSKGGRQRLCLAGAMLAGARVVLLDEPSTGLDPQAQDELEGIIRGIAASGSAVIVCTHALPIALAVASRIAFYVRGRIAREFARSEVASVEALRERYLRATGEAAEAKTP